MKGGSGMKCGHERVKSVNGVVSCIDCGEILQNYFKTAVNVQKQAEKPPEEAKPGKSPGRKRTR